MEFRQQLTINASQDQVMDCLINDEKQQHWMKEWAGVKYPNGIDYDRPIGTRFIQKLNEGPRVGTYQGEIIGYDDAGYFAVRLKSQHMIIEVHYRLQSIEQGAQPRTQLNFYCSIQYRGLASQLKDMVASGYIKQSFQDNLYRLKQLAEKGKPDDASTRSFSSRSSRKAVV